MNLAPYLTPHGILGLEESDGGIAVEAELGGRLLAAFAKGAGHGLLLLGADEVGTVLPPVFSYWRAFGSSYVTALCALPGISQKAIGDRGGDGAGKPAVPPPDDSELSRLAAAAPPMRGAEYITASLLADLWRGIDAAFDIELAEARLTEPRSAEPSPEVQEFLKNRHSAWNLVGRVHFNLAENRRDADAPFAFLATYTTRLSATAKAQHLHLGKALQNYAGARNAKRLLALLMPVQRAAESCPWLKEMVDRGEIYHPLRWSPAEALQFLQDVPAMEAAGIVVRMPRSWRMNRPAHPKVTATVGGTEPAQLGMTAMLDFEMKLTLDGEALTKAEIRDLLAQSDGLALIRGQWVEVDHERLTRTLAQFEAIERRASGAGLSFAEAMRMLSGAGISGDDAASEIAADWSDCVAGPWLADALADLRNPDSLGARAGPGKSLKATLRPYQQAGVEWLHLLARLRLGACLADDMGLGKTIQVLALLLVLKRDARKLDAKAAEAGAAKNRAKSANKSGNKSANKTGSHRDGKPGRRSSRKPGCRASLLVAPASLLANWAAEIDKFAPSLKLLIAHPSAVPSAELKASTGPDLSAIDLVITSYGSASRILWLNTLSWQLLILDEAQAIKNPGTRQTKAVKALKAETRIALTGTPIENRLGDLWSIFDFLNPGLLGSAKQFKSFVKRLNERPHNPYEPLRDLARPYILRRLKTDKSIIADLPDKTEVKTYCLLARKQAALYSQAVDDLADALEDAGDGMKRKGLVLSFLMRLKQICNHPSQWLGDGAWAEADSGKFARLRDIAEVIAARQEKALIFTQFKETTAPLAAFLGEVFGRPGLVLHGATPVKKRQDLVRRFQECEDVPFFVLSVKAGGTGLNLTAASHVIHFDRWWNPAVENQATDRAFRIGQTRNVLVHKFVCQGTIEDRIDKMIESKKQLAGDFFKGGADTQLTELRDDELLKLVTLDLDAAMKET